LSIVTNRGALDRISSFVPARTIESVKREFGVSRIIKLAGNENNMGCSPLAKAAMQRAFEELGQYPDTDCTLLREKLAEKHGVAPQQLVFGSGLFELSSLIALSYINEGDEVIIPSPSFGWYQIVTLEMNGQPVKVPLNASYGIDLEAVAAAVTDRTKMIWLCNPNNPTGTLFRHGELEKLLQQLPERILVALDEAYCDFVDAGDYPDSVALQAKYPNLLVLRTFSKAYGLAALRVGYGIGSADIVATIDKIRPPVNLNTLAQEAALASLEDTDYLEAVLANNRRGKQLYYSAFDELGLSYIPTECNFVMVDTGLDSEFVEHELLKQGVLIRSGKDFGLPTSVRISIGTYEENVEVIGLFKTIITAQRSLD
jgi:histidinol-phosphate aminotransferase